VAVVTLLLLALAACADAPIPIVPTPGNPCGRTGVACATQHTCCDEGETCGGEPASVGCPAGECCFIGEDDGLMAMRKHKKQRTQ
jgi:hypothetical protein